MLWAIYGCIESTFLWYKLFSTTLESIGIEINTYDRCVADKIIEGKQCTIAWCVDGNKLAHKKTAVISNIINKIKKHLYIYML